MDGLKGKWLDLWESNHGFHEVGLLDETIAYPLPFLAVGDVIRIHTSFSAVNYSRETHEHSAMKKGTLIEVFRIRISPLDIDHYIVALLFKRFPRGRDFYMSTGIRERAEHLHPLELLALAEYPSRVKVLAIPGAID